MSQFEEIDATWSRVISVWWLIMWRSLVGVVVFSFVVGFLLGFALASVGVEESRVAIVGGIAGGVIGLGWGIVVTRMALRKRYTGFRLALVRNNA